MIGITQHPLSGTGNNSKQAISRSMELEGPSPAHLTLVGKRGTIDLLTAYGSSSLAKNLGQLCLEKIEANGRRWVR